MRNLLSGKSLDLVIGRSGDLVIGKSPNHQITKSLNHQITKSQSGFLLLELTIAMTIIATGMLTAMYAFSTSSANAGLVIREQTACMLARQKMAETLLERSLSAVEDEGAWDPDFPGFLWKKSVSLAEDAEGLQWFEVRVTVNHRGRRPEEAFALDTRVARRKISSIQGPTQ